MVREVRAAGQQKDQRSGFGFAAVGGNAVAAREDPAVSARPDSTMEAGTGPGRLIAEATPDGDSGGSAAGSGSGRLLRPGKAAWPGRKGETQKVEARTGDGWSNR
ncbi:hypothetical protein M011DRAFT_61916 [Sporormia fimetaria CBS 119925]|uniref:Uncharacterized protein n=1 Tax=Sporormia fimetaria CBS 119925 TaxID=1340428 RepID=A0A6A6VD87_9PLEO|nr:hypothetical protein M011DRAFT_61916 [Sporormia fimetaria CBS 119925]